MIMFSGAVVTSADEKMDEVHTMLRKCRDL